MKQPGDPQLTVIPCTLREANRFVRHLHRHHPPARGEKFSLAVVDETGKVRGVAIVSRPIARLLDNGWTAEVTRVATDGCRNACSALYGAAWRAARGMGYRRMVTYTLPEEGGASLRGAGWRLVIEETGEPKWHRIGRPRKEPAVPGSKRRWEVGEVAIPMPKPDFEWVAPSPQLALPLDATGSQ